MSASIFEDQGFLVTNPLMGSFDMAQLDDIISDLGSDSVGTRHLLAHAWCVELAQWLRRQQSIAPLLASASTAVQCSLFEKSNDRNWLVPIHQDLSIAVAEKIAHPALTGWSEKEEMLFVQPPADVLHKMVAVRLHIDPCGVDDGPLRVVPGSHKLGRLSGQAAGSERERLGETVCPVERGAVMLMKPLLLHASSKAGGTSRRRVLHFVFAPLLLPFGLSWRHAV